MADLTPTDFLLARIAEDEEIARAAARIDHGTASGSGRFEDRPHWAAYQATDYYGGLSVDPCMTAADAEAHLRETVAEHMGEEDDESRHITRHDPARVLAECEAKRRIVDQFQRARADDDAETDTEQGWVTFGVARALFETVRTLAAVYADHPDYREEWRP